MMRFLSKSLFALLGLGVLSSSTVAQNGDWANLKQLLPGEQMKVILNNGKSHKGVLRSVSDDAVTIGNGESYQRQDVRRVLLRKPSHRGRNALIGLGIGAAAGLGTGAAVDSDCSKTSFMCTGNLGKAVLTPLFGGIGAGIGALLPTGGWREMYRIK